MAYFLRIRDKTKDKNTDVTFAEFFFSDRSAAKVIGKKLLPLTKSNVIIELHSNFYDMYNLEILNRNTKMWDLT